MTTTAPATTVTVTPGINTMAGAKQKVKLRAYLPEDPVLWFVIASQTFEQLGVTDDKDKITYVLRYLPNEIVLNLSDIVTGKTAATYEQLKNRICNSYGASVESRLDQLLAPRSFAGKPSQILMEMRRLVGDVTHTGEAILKRIWKSKLPSAVSMVLPLLPADKSFDELAKATDSLWNEYYANFNNATQPTYSTTSFAIPHA